MSQDIVLAIINKKVKETKEIFDSDTFAVEQCGISPYILEKALAKSYEYEIRNIGQKTDLTQERLDRYVKEMKTRKENVRRLIHEFEDKETSR